MLPLHNAKQDQCAGDGQGKSFNEALMISPLKLPKVLVDGLQATQNLSPMNWVHDQFEALAFRTSSYVPKYAYQELYQ